jgi:hypothetical protein
MVLSPLSLTNTRLKGSAVCPSQESLYTHSPKHKRTRSKGSVMVELVASSIVIVIVVMYRG